MPEITVIIPAFNAERTLVRTVASVTEQTIHDIEVIIVDDGSADSTGAIADRLANSDERVKVIHQANAGCYAARLAGMKKAKSPYFGFVDADDFIDARMYEHLLRFAKDNQLDIAQCDWFGHRRNNGVPQIFGTREEVVSQVILPRLVEGVDSMMVWDKVYRNHYDFSKWPEGMFATHEDLVHNFMLFEKASRVGYLNEELYHYNITNASSTRNFSFSRIAALENTIRIRRELIVRLGIGDCRKEDACWVVKNIRNGIVAASAGTAGTMAERKKNVRGLLDVPELEDAIRSLHGTVTGSIRFIRCFSVLPLGLAISGFRLMKGISRLMSALAL